MSLVYSKFECGNSNAAYYFFHIPKTAGTSLNYFLHTVFREDEICPSYLWHEILRCSPNDLRNYKLFRGHFYAYLNTLIDIPLRGFVFLRDPIARALSHYGHVTRDQNHYIHSRAKELGTFEAYLKDPVTRETVHNFQAKSLTQFLNPIEIASKLTPEALESLELEKILETTPTNISDKDLLECSISALREFCCIGIAEKFKESVDLLGETFGWIVPDGTRNLNVNPQRLVFSSLTDIEKSLLLELNSIDIELYQNALKEFQVRLQKSKVRKPKMSLGAFTSYAQNFEDVMLWRALKHIENGLYVDVGAQHPVIDSVSKAFYERGWRGIHIEPVPQYAELLREDRPDETILQVAVGDIEGTLELNVIPDTGLSTAVDEYAERHKLDRGYERQRIQVPLLTLKSALESLAGKEIHWLKIDVEGFEEQVIKGWDHRSLRPWIIVIEATIPNSPETNYTNWDPIITAAGYQFVYFDGLNRFYVSNEHTELAQAFSCPPNFFDDVVLTANSYLCRGVIAAQHATEQRLIEESNQRTRNLESQLESTRQRAEQDHAELRTHAQWLQKEWETAKAKNVEFDRELQTVYASKSWRITWPLRKTKQAIRWVSALPPLFKLRLAVHVPKRVARALLVWSLRKTLSNPRVKMRALHALATYPRLKDWLRQLAVRSGLVTPWGIAPPNLPEELTENLSPYAARVYTDLKRAIEARNR